MRVQVNNVTKGKTEVVNNSTFDLNFALAIIICIPSL
jgi:hypothetical protein